MNTVTRIQGENTTPKPLTVRDLKRRAIFRVTGDDDNTWYMRTSFADCYAVNWSTGFICGDGILNHIVAEVLPVGDVLQIGPEVTDE
jgi:hypothetical protein